MRKGMDSWMPSRKRQRGQKVPPSARETIGDGGQEGPIAEEMQQFSDVLHQPRGLGKDVRRQEGP